MIRSIRVLALCLPLALGACVTSSGGGGIVLPVPSITPVVVSPSTPAVVSPSIISQVVAGTVQACAFEPTAATVLGIAGNFVPTAATIRTIVSEICAVANRLKLSRSVRSGSTVTLTVRGVAVRGRFVRSTG